MSPASSNDANDLDVESAQIHAPRNAEIGRPHGHFSHRQRIHIR